jgi:3-deoxy-D-manno-octulosonic-acid transferase
VFRILYEAILTIVLLVMLPKQLWKQVDLRERLGWGIDPIHKESRKLVWIHAVSLGETKAVTTLVERLREELNDPIFVISSITDTGHEEAIKAFPYAAKHLYLPLDFSWIMKPLFQKIQPDLVILTETDYWYNFLAEAKNIGAKLVVVNGKLSERSACRYRLVPWLTNRLFGLIDCFCIQSKDYQNRFLSIGVPEERITVTGNLKFDANTKPLDSQKLQAWRERLGISANDRVLTAGSTHDTEEKLILDAFKSLSKRFPSLKLIVVPRHPERFEIVAALLKAEGIPFARYSTGSCDESRVILLDATGLLKDCYQISELAVVAGSFTDKVGGHNILEPALYGVPVLFGPHMHTQPELERLVLEANAGLQVQPGKLEHSLEQLLADAARRQQISHHAQVFIERNRGSVERTLSALHNILNDSAD